MRVQTGPIMLVWLLRVPTFTIVSSLSLDRFLMALSKYIMFDEGGL